MALVNQSVEKVLGILEYMSQKPPQRLMDMSEDMDINASTLLRFLTTLKLHGYVDQEAETDKYFLTYKIRILGNYIDYNSSLRTICKPYMEKIAGMFGESCCLAIEENRKVVYIEIVETPGNMLRSMQRIGHLAPMHCTGIGKLFLTNYSDEEIDSLISEEGLQRYTDYTLVTKEQLVEELKGVKAAGIAYDNEECEIGARCVAGPIYDISGKVIAGISVTGPAPRLNDEFIQSKLDEFKEILSIISEKMGYCGKETNKK